MKAQKTTQVSGSSETHQAALEPAPSLKGEVIRLLQESRKSVPELAEVLGCSKDLVYAWRSRPNVYPTKDGALQLARAESSLLHREPIALARKWLSVSGRLPEISDSTDEGIRLEFDKLRTPDTKFDAEVEGKLLDQFLTHNTPMKGFDPQPKLPKYKIEELRSLVVAHLTFTNAMLRQNDWIKDNPASTLILVLLDYHKTHEDLLFFIAKMTENWVETDGESNPKLWTKVIYILPFDKHYDLNRLNSKYRDSFSGLPLEIKSKVKIYMRKCSEPLDLKVNLIAYANCRATENNLVIANGEILLGNDDLAWKLLFKRQAGQQIQNSDSSSDRRQARELTTWACPVDVSVLQALLTTLDIKSKIPSDFEGFHFEPESRKWESTPIE